MRILTSNPSAVLLSTLLYPMVILIINVDLFVKKASTKEEFDKVAEEGEFDYEF